MKVVLVVICIGFLPAAWKCEETLINARFDLEPRTRGITLYNVGKFRKFKKAYENDLAPKKSNVLGLYGAFGSDPLAAVKPEQKPRVKKVLSFYTEPAVRAKRSAKGGKVIKIKARSEKKAVQRSNPKHKSQKKHTNLSKRSKHSKKAVRGKSKHKLRSKTVERIANKSAKEKLNKMIKKLQVGRKGKTKKAAAKRHGRDGKKAKPKNKKPLSKGSGRRLIAAHDALIEDYPYVVSIQKKGVHWCSGALLNPRVVITTANCLWRSNRVSRMTVRAGSRYPERGGQVANIAEVRTHPKWSIRSLPDNDVGLVLLDRDIRFSENVHSVDLPGKRMMPKFQDAWVTSFGTDRRDGLVTNPERSLQMYHGRLLSRSQCNNVTMRYGVGVSDNFLCIAQAGHRAPCTRDTGAPAVSDGVVWGVASWGIRKLCGTERFPAMFSYLGSPSNVEFISDTLLDFMSDERRNPFPDRLPPTTSTRRSTTRTTRSTTIDSNDRSTLKSLT
ncbi:trypsin-3-like [Aricia agestis]|uniref:trypsin-3-like n=1 Tax=Aricia agestis TaxID=91739 RepID=UPI001C2023F1|nr:trypsin-3-like [Aricia agestis]